MDKIYLDTSIPSAYYDNSKPLRQLITQKWFENDAFEYELCISNLVFEELGKLPNQEKRESIEDINKRANRCWEKVKKRNSERIHA